jgi:Fe-S-cluster-containing hydrogenase component 2
MLSLCTRRATSYPTCIRTCPAHAVQHHNPHVYVLALHTLCNIIPPHVYVLALHTQCNINPTRIRKLPFTRRTTSYPSFIRTCTAHAVHIMSHTYTYLPCARRVHHAPTRIRTCPAQEVHIMPPHVYVLALRTPCTSCPHTYTYLPCTRRATYTLMYTYLPYIRVLFFIFSLVLLY